MEGDIQMGLFSKKKEVLQSPMAGTLLTLDKVPDEVFSQKMMGDGFAIDPSDGKVYAPFSGVITVAFPTKHAIGMKSKDGLEILIHIGMDTVELNGEGFTSHISEGQKIKQGDLLMEVDLAFIKEKGKPVITPVIFTQGQAVTVKNPGRTVSAKEEDIATIA